MRITSKAIAKLINKDHNYTRVLLKRRGITLRFSKTETAKLTTPYITNLKKIVSIISEYTQNDNNT